MDFSDWLNQQMQKNNLTPASLARQAGITEGTISHIFAGRRKPGIDFCVAISPIIKQSPETVLRAAGLLPPEKDRPNSLILDEINFKFSLLSPEKQKQLLDFLNFILAQK